MRKGNGSNSFSLHSGKRYRSRGGEGAPKSWGSFKVHPDIPQLSWVQQFSRVHSIIRKMPGANPSCAAVVLVLSPLLGWLCQSSVSRLPACTVGTNAPGNTATNPTPPLYPILLTEPQRGTEIYERWILESVPLRPVKLNSLQMWRHKRPLTVHLTVVTVCTAQPPVWRKINHYYSI